MTKIGSMHVLKTIKGGFKYRSSESSAPTWHSYNARKAQGSVTPTTIAYLPMLDAPATEYATIVNTLEILQTNTNHLGQRNTVVFFDQAMYSKAMELVLANKDKFEDIVLMMGGFHINMNFLAAVGKMIAELGWEELFTLSGIFTKNVSDNLLNAKPYSRCLAAHLALYETLVGLKLKAENDGVINQDHPLSRFWSTYIYLIDLCLCQLYAEKTGDWELYIQVLTSMIPVFFATDRQNYARWLSIHVHDMKGLEKRAPAVHSEFANGNFTVKRSAKKFSAVSADMALEQSINRDVKCQGGLIGKSSTDSARNKWFYTSHVKAMVSASLHDMIDLSGSAYGESDTHHTDNNYDQQKSVE